MVAEDSLSLELTPGRPRKLVVQPGWQLLGGLKAILKNLRVQVLFPTAVAAAMRRAAPP